MSDVVTGKIDNGSVGEATIGSYTGPVGVTRIGASTSYQLAFAGSLPARRSTSGTLDGRPVEILAVRRSDLDEQVIIVTVRLAAA